MSDDLKEVGAKALEGLGNPKEDSQEKEKDVKMEAKEPTPEEVEATREEKKARLTQVLSRGILNQKLQNLYDACVPEGRAGKYILDSDDEKIRYSNLGFTFEYSKEAKEHVGPDGKVRIGDVVLMTISLEDREILKEVKMDRTKENLGLGRREYNEKAQEAAVGGPVPFDESHLEIKRGG